MRRFDLGYRCLEISPAPFDLNAIRRYGKLTLSMSVGSQLARACERLVFDSTVVREDALEIVAPDCDLSVLGLAVLTREGACTCRVEPQAKFVTPDVRGIANESAALQSFLADHRQQTQTTFSAGSEEPFRHLDFKIMIIMASRTSRTSDTPTSGGRIFLQVQRSGCIRKRAHPESAWMMTLLSGFVAARL